MREFVCKYDWNVVYEKLEKCNVYIIIYIYIYLLVWAILSIGGIAYYVSYEYIHCVARNILHFIFILKYVCFFFISSTLKQICILYGKFYEGYFVQLCNKNILLSI